MNIEQLNQIIETLYQQTLQNPQRVEPYNITDNITLQVDTYSSPNGDGFYVICTVNTPNLNYKVTRIRNYGPNSKNEKDWPEEGIQKSIQNYISNCILKASVFINKHGFDADKKVILLNRLLNIKEQGLLATKPKLVSLYEWFNTIEQKALSGELVFTTPPYTFEEVISE